MRKLVMLGASAALATASFVTPASADHGEQACGAIVVGDTALGYIAVDSDGSGVWVYEESNGHAGLQRGGVTALGDTDSCQAGTANGGTPDTGIL